MKAIIIINEQHKILKQQEEQLNVLFDDVELLKVPAEGWSSTHQEEIAHRLAKEEAVVFVSPIPILLGKLARFSTHTKIFVFHNDKREKIETPDGKISFRLQPDGWQLIQI